jgi:hypothetical protein
VTVYVCPAIDAWPTRAGPLFSAMPMPTTPVVLPLALLVIVSQPLSLDVLHPQPVKVVTVIAVLPPAEPTESDVLLSE